MKSVWVKGWIDEHHVSLKGGSSDSLYVEFMAEGNTSEGLWVKASEVRWRKITDYKFKSTRKHRRGE